jgi:hypothetical protein
MLITQLGLFEIFIPRFFKAEEMLFKLILLTFFSEVSEVPLPLMALPMMFETFFLLLILSST